MCTTDQLSQHSIEKILSQCNVQRSIMEENLTELCGYENEFYSKGEEALQDGDEETAFVNFMRFITILTEAIGIDCKYVDALGGQKKCFYTRDAAKKLFQRLNTRYQCSSTVSGESDKSRMFRMNEIEKLELAAKVNRRSLVDSFSGKSISSDFGLTGFLNPKNSCFMNSILQCLSNTVDLATLFLKDFQKNHLNPKTNGHIITQLKAVFVEIWTKKFQSIDASSLRREIGRYDQLFAGYQQQDAHEFLRIIIEWMNIDLGTEPPVFPIPGGSLTAADEAWLAFTKGKENIILQSFYGQLKSTLKCVACSYESARYDCFSDLSLPIPAVKTLDINECLDNFFLGEEIDDWNFPTCKMNKTAVKKLDISKSPTILVFHFKRFQVDMKNFKMSKISKKISFPLDGLNITKHLAPSVRAIHHQHCTYSLYAVTNHYGRLNSGRYTAFCRNLQKWFKFDDKTVNQIDSSEVTTDNGYILFYVKNDKKK